MVDALPDSVRYVKNGVSGKWWKAAKAYGQIHAGWHDVPDDLLRTANLDAIESLIRSPQFGYGTKGSATRDINALLTLIDHPSRHVWVTFQDGCMWWCTVSDQLEINSENATEERGHFWLSCVLPWSDRSLGRLRHLVTSELPGNVAMLEGFRGTVCEPGASKQILRIIRNETDADVAATNRARQSYVDAVAKLVAHLGAKDFEVLVDLILMRTGWARLAKLGGVTEGIDIEVENAAAGEIAFVQVKSSAGQKVLNDYVARFNERRGHYQKMIFAVHSPQEDLAPPISESVQIWTGKKIAELVVRLGLGEWVAKRF
jgi:hypothetical protein